MVPRVNRELCVGCGKCLEVCPSDAIDTSQGYARINEEFCEECGVCSAFCTYRAIEIEFPLRGNHLD